MTDLKTLEERLVKLESEMKVLMDNVKPKELIDWSNLFPRQEVTTILSSSNRMSRESIERVYGNCKDGSYELALQMNGYDLDV